MKARLARSAPLLLAVCLLFPSLTHAIDVEFVAITAGSAREDGTLLEYFISFSLDGADIAAASVIKPGVPPTVICAMVEEVPNAWNCDLGGFASLDDICQNIGFGDFLFELTAAAGSDDNVVVFFDPGCTDPIAGYSDITAPTSGGTVPPVPGPQDFCWDCSAPAECGRGDTAVSLFDANSDLAVELLRSVSVPACWDPGICLQTGSDYEFEVSALAIESDFETLSTGLGDEYVYVSAFENLNLTFFDVTAPVPTTPPAVPAGTGVSEAMKTVKLIADASTLELSWDVDSCCGVTDHHLVYGTGADLPAALGGVYSLDGSECSLGSSGTFVWSSVPDPGVGDFLWWVILANDMATTEGSWGTDSSGQERTGPGSGGVSAQCGMATKDPSNACGR